MIKPGLERIAKLVHNTRYSWKAIHVAGTNGKGSICHYADSLLRRRNIRVGKFTSPHLVDRWDCISINGEVVDEGLFKSVEAHYTKLNLMHNINASNFEILTATAFRIFNDQQVDVGVVEVGMGGQLDATNILEDKLVTVISKIAHDHEGFLGRTLDEIALHKAGILRRSVPYVVSSSNEKSVQDVIDQHARNVHAGPRLSLDTVSMKDIFELQHWQLLERTLLPFQRENAVLAMRAVQSAVKTLRRNFPNHKMAEAAVQLFTKPMPGRQQLIKVPPVFGATSKTTILVDGAHNPDAAKELRHVVKNLRYALKYQKSGPNLEPPRQGWPVTWVLAMTEGKDASNYLRHLLEPGDNLVATSFGPVDGMPWVKPTDPNILLETARSLHHGFSGVTVPEADPFRALCAAKAFSNAQGPIVLAGSLYLVGDFHRAMRVWEHHEKRSEVEPESKLAFDSEMQKVQTEQQHRVNVALSSGSRSKSTSDSPSTVETTSDLTQATRQRRQMLQQQLEEINTQFEDLSAKNQKKTLDIHRQLDDIEDEISNLTSSPRIRHIFR